MKVKEAINKYNLTLQPRDGFNKPYSYKLYSREKIINNVKTIYTITQDELAKEEGINLYFLIIEKFYLNQTYIDKHGQAHIKTRITVKEIEND